ncbi:MAG: menaquinol oxidoreductase [Armatimonadota bacterium]|nr:menaquinol oxidoreductase [Armatimonadota bacterium]
MPKEVEGEYEVFPDNPHKTYGLMAVVKGKSPVVDKSPEDTVMTWPHLLIRELVASVVVMAVLLAISLVLNAPLEEHANLTETPNPAKAPWYFLGLQELVHYSALIGGVIIPGLSLFLLAALPYLDRTPDRAPSKRKLLTVVFTVFIIVNVVLIVIGSYFRGPGWSFIVPWRGGSVQ